MPRVFILQYALSSGVFEHDVRFCDSFNTRYATARNGLARIFTADFALDQADAVAQVRRKIAAKRKSIKLQLKKLDAIAKDLDDGILPMVKEKKGKATR